MKRRATSNAAIGGLLLVTLACAATVQAEPRRPIDDAPAPEVRAKKPLDFYRGLEPRRRTSRSRVEGVGHRQIFDPILQGDILVHDFVIPNPGDTAVELRNVKACSGCILNGYTKSIPPGQEGRVSILVTTDAFGGQRIESPITFATSDPARPEIRIDVALDVIAFVRLLPYRIWLEGVAGDEIVAKALVIPTDERPFSIRAIKARKGIWFEWEQREIEHQGHKAWEITLRNTRDRPGPYQDVLFVQTDHPDRPEFRLRVEGRIAEAPGD